MINCVVLGEHRDDDDDDDVGAKSWRLHWKSSIGKHNRRDARLHDVDAHLLEDRTLVYAWMVCRKKRESFAENRKERS
jgi:hypothetical protein